MSRKSHREREQERRKTTHPFHSFSFLSCHVSKSIVNVDIHQKSFLTSPILLLVNSLQQIVINIIPVDIATFYYTFQWQTNHSFRYQFLLTLYAPLLCWPSCKFPHFCSSFIVICSTFIYSLCHLATRHGTPSIDMSLLKLKNLEEELMKYFIVS